MAEDNGVPTIPSNSNWSEWTFEQVVSAITDEGLDLHQLADKQWFTFDKDAGASTAYNYHAWGEYFVAVNPNQEASRAWYDGAELMDEIMQDVGRGKRGSMDLQTLKDFQTAISALATFTGNTGDEFVDWANSINSDDSSFKGKAAFLIYWRMKVNGDGMHDTNEQITTRHQRPVADVVGDAVTALETFNSTMQGKWVLAYMLNISNWMANGLNGAADAAFEYMKRNGLFISEPNYVLNAFSNADEGKAWIRKILGEYPDGNLGTQEGWNQIGNKVRDTTIQLLKDMLDTPAQAAIALLAPKYQLATSALIKIDAPPPETPPTVPPPNPGGGDGNIPPPGGGGGGNIPPPPGGGGDGNIPPPGGGGGGDGNLPPPGGAGGGSGADLPPPGGAGGGSGLDLPPPGGAGGGSGADLPPPGGAGGGSGADLPPPGGAGGGNGGGSFVPPGLLPPGGLPGGGGKGRGGGGGAPGGDGSFIEHPGGDGVVRPHGNGSGGLNVPSGLARGATDLNRHSASGGFGGDPGGGNGISGTGMVDGDGNGLTGAPSRIVGGFGGAGGGPGGGLGGADGLGGAAGAAGAPGAGNGSGGVPFFPPMMGGGGGMGGGGDKPQERERQTWLSEDEEIWGTRVTLGPGVIGHPDDEDFEAYEVPLTGPVRGRRQDDKRRRRRDERAPETQTVEAEAGTETAVAGEPEPEPRREERPAQKPTTEESPGAGATG
jgi:hypothetical protein